MILFLNSSRIYFPNAFQASNSHLTQVTTIAIEEMDHEIATKKTHQTYCSLRMPTSDRQLEPKIPTQQTVKVAKDLCAGRIVPDSVLGTWISLGA